MLKEMSLEIIRKCPNQCLHCSSLSNINCVESITYEKFIEVVSDAAQLGVETVCLSGGEPFLHEDITEMVRFVHDKGLNCYIYTSGIFIDEKKEKSSLPLYLLESLIGNVTKLIFNVEAVKESTYNEIMGTKNCFKKMQQSIKDAARLGICAEAHFVPMALNISEISDVIAMCSELGISKVSFLRLVLHGRAEQNIEKIALSEIEYQHLKQQLFELSKESGLPIRIGVPLSNDTMCHKCEAAYGKLNIRYDGKVFPCEVFKNGRVKNQLKGLKPDSIYEKSLCDIYNHSVYLECVREISEKFSDIQTCETCIGQYLINLKEEDI